MKSIFLTFIAVVLWGSLSEAALTADVFHQQRQVIAQDSHGHTTLWKITNVSELHLPIATNNLRYSDYVAWVRKNTSWDAKRGLQNHVDLVQGHLDQQKNSSMTQELLKSQRNALSVLADRIGIIKPMSNLDAVPFLELLETVDLRKSPIEFFVVILQKADELILIGDFSPNNDKGVAQSAGARKKQKELELAGWETLTHYHNHPFEFSIETLDIGGNLCPSGPDVRLYKTKGFKSAIISNGIETLYLNSQDIHQLEY